MSDDINKLASELAARYRTGRLVKAAAVEGPALPPGTGGYTPAMNRPFPENPVAPPSDWLTTLQNGAGSAWGKLPPALQYALIGGGGLGALGLLSDPGEDAAGRKRSRLTRALRGLLLGGGLGGGLGLALQAAPGVGAAPGSSSPELAKAETANARQQAILNPPDDPPAQSTPARLLSQAPGYAMRQLQQFWNAPQGEQAAELWGHHDRDSSALGSVFTGGLRGAGLGAAAGAGRAVGQNLESAYALRNPQTIKLKDLLDGLRVPTGEQQPAPGRIPGAGKMVDRYVTGLEGLRQAMAGSAKSEALRTPPPGDPGQAAVMDKRIVTPARPFAAEKYQYLQRVPAQVGKPYQTSTGRIVTPPSLPARYSKHLVQPAQPATPAVMEDYIKQPARPAKPAILPTVSEEQLFEQLANTPKRPAIGAGATEHLLQQHGGAYTGGGSGLTPGEVQRLAKFQPKFQHQPVLRNAAGGAAGGALLGAGLGAAMPYVDRKVDSAVSAVKSVPTQLHNWWSPPAKPQRPTPPPGAAAALRAHSGL